MSTAPPDRDQLPDPPWNRIDITHHHESDPAYQAFTTYRDLGYDRSLVKVGRKLGKSETLIARWSVRWAWRIRVEEWDSDKETLKAAALNTSIQAMAERQASQAALAVEGLMVPHLALAKAMEDRDVVDLLATRTPSEMVKLAQSTAQSITVLMQAERLARGEPSDIVRTDMSVDVVEISDERLTAVASMLADAGFFDDYQGNDDDSDEPGSDDPGTSS